MNKRGLIQFDLLLNIVEKKPLKRYYRLNILLRCCNIIISRNKKLWTVHILLAKPIKTFGKMLNRTGIVCKERLVDGSKAMV